MSSEKNNNDADLKKELFILQSLLYSYVWKI